MNDSNPTKLTDNRIRVLRLVWLLLPFPLFNILILPAGLLIAYCTTLPSFVGVYFSPDAVRSFPSPEQIHNYGIDFYRTMLSQSMALIIFSSVLWGIDLLLFLKAIKNLKSPEQNASKSKSLLKHGIGFTALSILSGISLMLAIALMG
jgi:hypothetical protein